MKTIGILGGMGPQASVDLYHKIIKYTKATRDQDHIPVWLYSWPQIADRTASILNQMDEALPQLIAGAIKLDKAGADYIAIACLTAHYYIEKVSDSVSIPVLNMLELTKVALLELNLRRILVLATDGAHQVGLFQKALNQAGIEQVSLSPQDQSHVMEIIYDKIKAGKAQGVVESLEAIIENYVPTGIDGVILGCTELAIYADKLAIDTIQVIDPVTELAKCCITMAGGAITSQ